jgi:hypothetical protein
MGLKSLCSLAALILPVAVGVGCWFLCARREAAALAAPAAACDLSCSLAPPELADRRARLARFRSSAREITPLASGYKLVFALDEPTFREATDLILAESRCCGFLEFRLTVQPAHKLLALEISGPAGTKEFLASVVGPVENRGEESGDSR